MLSSATNTLRALELLVERREAGVSELGRALSVTPGTAHRLVGTLVAEGFAEQNAGNRKYRPGDKILALADRMRSGYDLREMAHNHLVALSDTVHETVNLGMLQDNRIVYVDKVLSDQVFGIEAKVGSRVPAFCTALGKATLAFLDRPALERYLAAMQDGSAGDATHVAPSREALEKELGKVARRGYAEDLGEYLPDVFCVAAPILDAEQRAVAALSVSAPRSRFRSNRAQLAVEVRHVADELSRAFQTLGVSLAAM